METIKLTSRTDSTGKLHLELPTSLADQNVEVVVVVQPTNDEPRDALGWPVGYFEETYGIFADDPIERGDQGTFETREPME
jgi:hypothetical protein